MSSPNCCFLPCIQVSQIFLIISNLQMTLKGWAHHTTFTVKWASCSKKFLKGFILSKPVGLLTFKSSARISVINRERKFIPWGEKNYGNDEFLSPEKWKKYDVINLPGGNLPFFKGSTVIRYHLISAADCTIFSNNGYQISLLIWNLYVSSFRVSIFKTVVISSKSSLCKYLQKLRTVLSNTQ